jgi:hypothetical protein
VREITLAIVALELTKAASNLRVRRFVTVLGEEARDVIKNFFLTLRGQHGFTTFRVEPDSKHKGGIVKKLSLVPRIPCRNISKRETKSSLIDFSSPPLSAKIANGDTGARMNHAQDARTTFTLHLCGCEKLFDSAAPDRINVSAFDRKACNRFGPRHL